VSRLCRLKTKTHGEDGKWAYEEIIKLRLHLVAEQSEIQRLKALCGQLGNHLTIAMAYVPIGGYGYDDCDSALTAWRNSK